MTTAQYKKRLETVAETLSRKPACKLNETLITATRQLVRVIETVEDVEDIVGKPGTPCPVQGQSAILTIRDLLGIPAYGHRRNKRLSAPEKSVKTVDVPDLTCGAGPYHAKIVSIRDPVHCVYWYGKRSYRTENAAVKAVLQKVRQEARNRKVWGVDPYVRHWITERKEHTIDFGSHDYYGVVTGRETK